ncbi:MAG: cadherin domain-containing protein [Thermoleophilia bacterium]|nr:cadherin domain-containing protein [Thermoleophilia bacterium]
MRTGIARVFLPSLMVFALLLVAMASPAMAAEVHVSGTDGNDTITVSRSDGACRCVVNSDPAVILAEDDTLKVYGLGGDDVLVVDLAGGIPIPTDGDIDYYGDSGDGSVTSLGDSLKITDSSGGGPLALYLGHHFTSDHGGVVQISLGLVSYEELGSVVVDIESSEMGMILPTAPGDEAVLEDDGDTTNGVSRLRSINGAFVLTTFVHPTRQLDIWTFDPYAVSIGALETATFTPHLVLVGPPTGDTPTRFELTGPDVLPDSVSLEVWYQGVLDMKGFDLVIDGLSGNGTVENTEVIGRLYVGSGGASSTFTGVIRGMNRVEKLGGGTLTLTGTHFTRFMLRDGTLLLTGTGLVYGEVAVDRPATLGGSGAISDGIMSRGTIKPGDSGIGTLACGGDVLLDGDSIVSMEINKSGVTCTSDRLCIDGSSHGLECAGTLTVTASGDALRGGDEFDLFDVTPLTGPPFSGAFSTVNLPALGAGLGWDTSGLLLDGTIKVVAVNASPVFTSPADFFVDENTIFVARVAAADFEGDRLSYSIAGGPDATLFAIGPRTRVLTFRTPPDYEAPADAGGDNTYNLTVQVSDGSAVTTQAVSVHVVDVREGPVSHSPVITSDGGHDGAVFSVPENTTAVATVEAIDPDPGAVLTFDIMGGPDADQFQIDPVTGVLTFSTAPDHERPTDVGHDNIYRITVRVSDGANADTQVLTITVTNVVEQTTLPATDRWNDITDEEWVDTYGVTAAEVDRVADGGADGGFHPGAIVTRGQFGKMVVDGFGIAKASAGPPSFSDVPTSHAFFAWIQGGADAGVLSGLLDGFFAPGRSITRQQAASVLGRWVAAQELATAGAIQCAQGAYPTLEAWFAAEGVALLAAFADGGDLAAVHAPYVAYLVHKGVMQGASVGGSLYLLPRGSLTRAQAAVTIVRTGV